MANGPLAGLKVVDFSRVLAGPHCAKTLHDLGADVIKIEPPRPDISRSALPKNDTMSYYYIQQNTGKRNISLDLNHPEARDIAMELCRQADIVVENFRAGTLAFFGLDYESVRQQNPRVVYASISGYGQGGPLSHRAAYAPTVHAESGFTSTFLSHLSGDLATDRHDAYSHADIYTGLEAVIGILAALHKRSLTNEGQYVDIAMAATMLSVNERVHIDLSGVDIGAEPAALGPAQSPFFTTVGGEKITIATSVVSSLTFPFYLTAMRRPELASDPRFSTPALRAKNLEAFHAIVQNWILTFDSLDTLDAQLDEAKLAFGVVRDIGDFARSDWAEWWGAIDEVDDRAGGMVRIPGKPWRFSADKLDHPGVPAFRGEHNKEVLKELGRCEKEIDALTRKGAITADPVPQ
ncbi:CoA transferase (plasmid) [Cupriavidus sp. KK10]|jgi:crotonobetainyl-CoA:carnitine CoA-transferase CaiB-like acyl-CoA transferase|uniref:CaiB/BaiF CoA transferase family protein n=1 Tax=Cupriavidus sp. KK10 TaxID=1478019 RepID=UPI001BA8E039|nr:CaiB/BaiF CoA-transferase family protein [Cupriavidus sp. KK10]QUN32536.1 CoA transferase [Cupriavidus sp. KK10]